MWTLILSFAVTQAFLVGGTTLNPRQAETSQVVAPALYDGQCFYPQPDIADFKLDQYLGRWYQVAGTAFGPTAGCKCIYAEYSLNENGTVNVFNGCEASGREIRIEGTATPADPVYGTDGAFRVQFPGQPPESCPGPNYIVQDILPAGLAENSWAIVQAANFSTLFLLSREQNPPTEQIDTWLQRAGALGTNLDEVVKTEQTSCSFT